MNGKMVIGMRNNSGFTIMEVLVGFTILLVGATAILSFLISFYKYNIVIQNRTKARNLGTTFSEKLKSRGYSTPLLANDGNNNDLDDFANPDHTDVDTLDDQIFRLAWNVKDSSGLKTVKTRISWTRAEEEYHYEFVTSKAE